jgi:acetyltransferase-like isoleucine patch superfamily enzyme
MAVGHEQLEPRRSDIGCWMRTYATVTEGTTVGAAVTLAANAVAIVSVPDERIIGRMPACGLYGNVVSEVRGG